MATRHGITNVSEIPAGKDRVMEVASRQVAIFNVDGKFLAIDNTCPHRGGPLGDGMVIGNIITYP